MNYFYLLILITLVFPQEINCPSENLTILRSTYNIGDTISIDDQNMLFPVCNAADGYLIDDSFSFSDLNGNLNGGEYKITIISMNATW